MKSLIEKIQDTIPTLPERHSFFQLKHFVIGKEPTVQSQIQACIRELSTRKDDLEALQLEIADEHDNKRLLELHLEKRLAAKQSEKNQIMQRKLKRQISSKEKRIGKLRNRLQSIEQETLFLIEVFEALQKKEPLKEWDEMSVQLEYWNKNLTNEFHTRLILTNSMDNELIRTIMALPDETPIKKELISMYSSRVNALQQSVKLLPEKDK